MLDHVEYDRHGSDRVKTIRQNAQQLIEKVIAKENLEVEEITPLLGGIWSAVFLLQPERVVLKFPNDQYESHFFEYCNELKLPVPKIKSSGFVNHSALNGVYYVILEYVHNSHNPETLFYDGLLEEQKLMKLGQNVGQFLTTLHSKRFDYLGNDDTSFENWGEILKERFNIPYENLTTTNIYNLPLLKKLQTVVDQNPEYFIQSTGNLMHGDLNLGNVLVDENHEMICVIDPWEYYAGNAMYDLAYASIPWEYGMDYHKTVIETYKKQSEYFNQKHYYLSTLLVAYWENRNEEDESQIKKIQSFLDNYIFGQLL